MPISRVRLSAVNEESPKSPRQAMKTVSRAKVLKIRPILYSAR